MPFKRLIESKHLRNYESVLGMQFHIYKKIA